MYEAYYLNIEDTDAYLNRIHMDPADFRPDREHLNELLYKHHRFVPFDNLNVWDKAEQPSLEIPDLFKKIVIDRRGGYCYEMNALLEAALRTLGYECYGVQIRITRGRDFIPPFRHRGVVCILDGKKLFCDVGLGFKFFPEYAEFDAGYNKSGYKVIKKDGGCTLYELAEDGSDKEILWFPDMAIPAVDFLNPNICCSVDPSSNFRNRLTTVIMTPEGYRKTLTCFEPSPRRLCDDAPEFTVNVKNGSQLISENKYNGTAALSTVLREEFGIVYNW